MVWPCTNISCFIVTEAKFKGMDLEASICRFRMINQSRAEGCDAEVPQASCRIMGKEAHDDTMPEERARRVKAGTNLCWLSKELRERALELLDLLPPLLLGWKRRSQNFG